MKKYILLIFQIFGITSASLVVAQSYQVQPIPFNQVSIDDDFWSPRLKSHSLNTLQTCIHQTRDSTERINNFKKAAGLLEGQHQGIYFDDSDVYKAMEGIAYSLINNPNPEYEKLLDDWISYIAKSQQADGYLNTFYTLNHPDERWTDMEKHEMYCGGHMIEAAIAHYQATGKKSFLDVAIKFADYLDNTFGPGKRHWVAGHEEIELALVKLYHTTGSKEYLNLAHWLLEERGHGHGKGGIWESEWGPAYCQDDVPVSEIADIKGHAVRAMYLFTGMADVASEMNIPEYVDALKRVWEDVTQRNMYVTGGIGSSRSNEGFTEDYDLPNKTAYCETCASIGMVFWNNRMNLLSKDAKYVDILERSLYNGVLSGVNLEGNLFFYVNPLESDGDHHRQRWFGCACCPSNISRFVPSIGSYIYLKNDNEVFVNLYIGNEVNVELAKTNVHLTQKTNYPWDGEIAISIDPETSVPFNLKLRIPGWCKSFRASLNGKTIEVSSVEDGYLSIERNWAQGDKITLSLDMPVELIKADDRVAENKNKRAIQRGPLVYCVEQIDNATTNIDEITISRNNIFTVNQGGGKLNNMKVLTTTDKTNKLTFIPYFAWDNREPGKMEVWINYKNQSSLYTN
ncbi:glycoside hydrolase family 127 protein [Maribellus maritimus]|uniref:glycoside hydrolase family 127 protein n=1 Tax=Maribellus maritimus TaxID=2870838 RepID=UPI001EEAA403|nr:beta-L-arabinofuranosidase domain-containing protein [Maribellus maritimus]MCG6190117.1 glycoside hydrolase family 127 protein [Maribellus maritimus]